MRRALPERKSINFQLRWREKCKSFMTEESLESAHVAVDTRLIAATIRCFIVVSYRCSLFGFLTAFSHASPPFVSKSKIIFDVR